MLELRATSSNGSSESRGVKKGTGWSKGLRAAGARMQTGGDTRKEGRQGRGKTETEKKRGDGIVPRLSV